MIRNIFGFGMRAEFFLAGGILALLYGMVGIANRRAALAEVMEYALAAAKSTEECSTESAERLRELEWALRANNSLLCGHALTGAEPGREFRFETMPPSDKRVLEVVAADSITKGDVVLVLPRGIFGGYTATKPTYTCHTRPP